MEKSTKGEGAMTERKNTCGLNCSLSGTKTCSGSNCALGGHVGSMAKPMPMDEFIQSLRLVTNSFSTTN